MVQISFLTYGHENVLGSHKTTLELTSEDFLTLQGTCIIGIKSQLTLNKLGDDIKSLARKKSTKICLSLMVGDMKEEIVGYGSPGLTYSNDISMVVRTSFFECDRTLMVGADKAAADLSRSFIDRLRNPNQEIHCQLAFTSL